MSTSSSWDALEQLDKFGLYVEAEGRVEWHDGAGEHPKNWPVRRKILDTGVITLFVTISYVCAGESTLPPTDHMVCRAMIGNVGVGDCPAPA